METKEVVIVSACRTPIGKFSGSLANFSAVDLGVIAAKEAIKRAGISADVVQECIYGQVLQGGCGQNPARQVAHHAGIPDSTASLTINKVCGSSLKAVMLGAQAIMLGDFDCVLAGGMESMTNAPFFSRDHRFGSRLSVDINKGPQLVDMMVHDGLWEIYNDYHMGYTGELVAEKYEITREMQDEYAFHSNRKASEATAAGRFTEEIVPVPIPRRKGEPIMMTEDEGFVPNPSLERMAKARTVFKKDGGTVTAANASQLSDGAAAVVLMSAEKAKELNLKPIAKITGYSTGGMEPKWVMMAPVEAVKNLEKKYGVNRQDFDLIEFNEAFSSAALAVSKQLDFDMEKVNVNGGAVALGHPIGCSGARVLVTLIHALKQKEKKTGLAMLCLGGGNAVAMSIEML